MIVITGASKGIGKYLFEKFDEIGVPVLGIYNTTQPELEKVDFFSKVDICSQSDVSNWIEGIKLKLTKIILINCAGINYNSFAHKADLDAWSKVIETNLIGTFNIIHAVLPIMREQEYGRIINLSSIVAQVGVPGTSAYAASKSGLWGMVRSIAVENAKKGITINNLNLGYHNAGMINEVPEKYQAVLKQKIPTGDFGNPRNIFNAVNFLMNTDYINGTSIDINGGMF
jgi:NAD(P)-dependent dehydrogenase (short-subunit alcohol dehydrogenase family)